MLKILIFPILIFVMPGHLTMTSIDQIRGTDSLKVVIRLDYNLFLHDYQQTINDDLDLDVLRKYKTFPSDLANNYINSKLSIYINDKLLIGKLLKMEVTDGDIILNILYRLNKKLKSITVRNTLLTGLYSDVENLTIVRLMNFEKGIKFTQEHKQETFSLK